LGRQSFELQQIPFVTARVVKDRDRANSLLCLAPLARSDRAALRTRFCACGAIIDRLLVTGGAVQQFIRVLLTDAKIRLRSRAFLSAAA
jgi:hypothetical protein